MSDQAHELHREAAGAKGSASSTGMVETAGYDTPMRDERVTVGRLEREMGETPALAEPVEQPGNLIADGLSPDEREQRGIIDESRHTSSLGSR